MEVRRTAVVKLAVSDEQRGALHRTAEQYLYCANRTAEFCWSDTSYTEFDILPALKREDSHGTVPLGWDIVVYDVACS